MTENAELEEKEKKSYTPWEHIKFHLGATFLAPYASFLVCTLFLFIASRFGMAEPNINFLNMYIGGAVLLEVPLYYYVKIKASQCSPIFLGNHNAAGVKHYGLITPKHSSSDFTDPIDPNRSIYDSTSTHEYITRTQNIAAGAPASASAGTAAAYMIMNTIL
ncbi:MAG: hypothetical protein HOI53_05235 [Francisellaceae bacterium]|nr:hypothetical protein [Francisellaceae bacterium]